MGANPRNSIKKELLHERKSFIQQLSGSGRTALMGSAPGSYPFRFTGNGL